MIINRLHASLEYARKRDNVTGCIYFIECQGFVKIGLTSGDPYTRLGTLQTGCPFVLTLLNSVNSYDLKADEGLMHDHYGIYHVRGEWFKLPQHALERIATATHVQHLIIAAALDWQI